MAEILDSYEFTTRGRNDLYPYDEWLDGRIRRLQWGSDYQISTDGMRSLLYRHAYKRGLKLRTQVEPPPFLVIQAYDPNTVWRDGGEAL